MFLSCMIVLCNDDKGHGYCSWSPLIFQESLDGGHMYRSILTVISGRLPAGNVLIFPQTVVGAGYRKVRVM